MGELQLGAKVLEKIAPEAVAAIESSAVNLLSTIKEEVLGTEGWKSTKEVALRMGIMPADVAKMAREEVLDAQMVTTGWRINPTSVDNMLGRLADQHTRSYLNSLQRPFTGRGRALGMSSFRGALEDRQQQVALRLNLTPAGVAQEWEPAGGLSQRMQSLYARSEEDWLPFGSVKQWMNWRHKLAQ